MPRADVAIDLDGHFDANCFVWDTWMLRRRDPAAVAGRDRRREVDTSTPSAELIWFSETANAYTQRG